MNRNIESREQVLALAGRYRTIIVTGPQRSGTTAASQMIAEDLGYEYIDEAHHANEMAMLTRVCLGADGLRDGGFVLQAPALSWCIEMLPRVGSVIVVWMQRDRAAVIASQDRIGWTKQWERVELSRYITKWGCDAQERVVDAKVRTWEKKQRSRMRVDTATLSYESEYFQNHDRFLVQENRDYSHPKQKIP
jgi:hypothetical protein